MVVGKVTVHKSYLSQKIAVGVADQRFLNLIVKGWRQMHLHWSNDKIHICEGDFILASQS